MIMISLGLWSVLAAAAEQPVALVPTTAQANDLTLTKADDGSWEIQTTGADPYLFCDLAGPIDAASQHVLSFEYFCLTGTDGFQAFFLPPLSEGNSLKSKGLGVSEVFTSYTLDLAEAGSWGGPVERVRLDFGNRPDRTIRLRDLVLRPPSGRELELAAARSAKQQAEAELDRRLEQYLEADYPCRVTRVAVDAEQVRITAGLGDRPAPGVRLAEAPIDQDVTALGEPSFTAPATAEASWTLPRYRPEPGGVHDRLLSRWILIDAAGQPLSHARYADDDAVTPRADLPLPHPKSRKGIGGFGVSRFEGGRDADLLGIGYVTVNIMLSYLRPAGRDNTIAFDYCGRTFYADRKMVEGWDATMRFCAERGIVVSAIVLIPKADGFSQPLGDIFMHPDCDPSAIFSMANVSDHDGLLYYAAALNFLAERWSRPDGPYGRVHHWIVHNEVDAGWVWTNCGPKTLRLYMDLYHRSMRVAHLIARQYDAHAKSFISLTHHWTWAYDPRFFGSKEVLETLADDSRAEGDFDWGIAFHPYPESLRNPRCWEDKRVDYTFDTQLITFKNLEVLEAWVERRDMRYRGERIRTVHLSEQGPNSPDYSEASLRDQAACMAYAWKKLEPLQAIEAFQYHNWIDNRHEGGLRIGLRKFPDDEFKGEAKPVWSVYQQLDTPEEDAACAFALDVVGIKSWDEVRYTEPIR